RPGAVLPRRQDVRRGGARGRLLGEHAQAPPRPRQGAHARAAGAARRRPAGGAAGRGTGHRREGGGAGAAGRRRRQGRPGPWGGVSGAGQATGTVVSVRAGALARQALRATTMSKVKMIGALLLGAALLGVGVGLFASGPPAAPEQPEPKPPVAAAAPKAEE